MSPARARERVSGQTSPRYPKYREIGRQFSSVIVETHVMLYEIRRLASRCASSNGHASSRTFDNPAASISLKKSLRSSRTSLARATRHGFRLGFSSPAAGLIRPITAARTRPELSIQPMTTDLWQDCSAGREAASGTIAKESTQLADANRV